MNLRDLNTGTVNDKNWLNPVCNNLSCKNLIADNVGSKIYNMLENSQNINTSVEKSIFDNIVSDPALIPANSLKIGDSFAIDIGGNLSNVGGESLAFNLYMGPTSTTFVIPLVSTSNMSVATQNSYSMHVVFTVRNIGEFGKFSIVAKYQNNIDGGPFLNSSIKSQIVTSNFDTTIDNIINITSQFGTANVGNELITQVLTVVKL